MQISNQVWISLLPAVLVLGAAALAALSLVLRRTSVPEQARDRFIAARALALATVFQALHFSEEAMTGFPEKLGAIFGLPGMPFTVFLAFNLVWLAIWLVCIPGLRAARSGAFFAAWFLAIAALVNGIAHPLLALFVGGYFPGLFSSPLIGAAGIWLWLRLRRATR